LGLDAREYDIEVIEKTNKTAGRVFPITLNVEHPSFFKRLDVAAAANAKLAQVAESNLPKPLQFLQKLPHIATIGWQIVQLYFMKPIDTMVERGQVR
jgi:magnesium-protoporphyrin IX monomethyl ester (oxidative) cyclase